MQAGAWISLGLTVCIFGWLILMIFETVKLAREEKPITGYTRDLIRNYPHYTWSATFLITYGLGWLTGHFF